MKGLSFNAMRVGWKYRLVNFGDVYEFEIVKSLGGDNFRLKDLVTLEEYDLHDIVAFGKGKDFEISEIGQSFR